MIYKRTDLDWWIISYGRTKNSHTFDFCENVGRCEYAAKHEYKFDGQVFYRAGTIRHE